MSSPAPSNISQNDAEVLEKQRRHEEEQWLLVQLEEVAKSYQAECVAQKPKKEAKAKVREEVKRRRVAEEEKKKRRMMEYLQQLWNEVLEEDTTLLEDAEGSQIMGSKCKEIASRDEEG